jgi:hypothetical protein
MASYTHLRESPQYERDLNGQRLLWIFCGNPRACNGTADIPDHIQAHSLQRRSLDLGSSYQHHTEKA